MIILYRSDRSNNTLSGHTTTTRQQQQQQQQQQQPRPPSEPRLTKPLRRRSVEKPQQPKLDIAAQLANLDRLKNSGHVEKFDWSAMSSVGSATSAHLTSSHHAWEEKEANGNNNIHTMVSSSSGSVICPDCDKTYLSTRDLEIHKNFCYGKISK